MQDEPVPRDVKPHLRELVKALFNTVPTGVGRIGQVQVQRKETRRLMGEGPKFVIDRGLATPRDLDHTEANGRLDGADPDAGQRSRREARRRAVRHARHRQPLPGSAGRRSASSTRTPRRRSGLEKDQICVMIHSGCRGLGYQVCDDALADVPQLPGEVRHRAARPPARLRPGRQPGGPEVHRRDAGGGELRLVQSAAAHAAGPRGVRRRLRPIVARPAA